MVGRFLARLLRDFLLHDQQSDLLFDEEVALQEYKLGILTMGQKLEETAEGVNLAFGDGSHDPRDRRGSKRRSAW